MSDASSIGGAANKAVAQSGRGLVVAQNPEAASVGAQVLSESQQRNVRRLFSYYPDVDFSGYGL